MSAGPSHYAIVDVTSWRAIGDEQLGTKPKRWLMHPDSDERWLLKYVTYSTRNDGTHYQKGDDGRNASVRCGPRARDPGRTHRLLIHASRWDFCVG